MTEQYYKLTPGEALVLRTTSRCNLEARGLSPDTSVSRMGYRAIEKMYQPVTEVTPNPDLDQDDWRLIRETLTEAVMTRRAMGETSGPRYNTLQRLLHQLDGVASPSKLTV
jgi:hypothetical protein